MRGLVFADGKARVASVDKPSCGAEALIRVHLAGICATDREILRGYGAFSGIMGHEFVGTVEECRDSRWVGRRVVGEINCPCNTCPVCRRGDGIHCPSRQVLGIHGRNGAMAEYCLLPLDNLHEVPDSVSDRQAVFVEPLAAAVAILQRAPIAPSSQVAVIGDGRLGLLVAQVVALGGAEVTLVGRHPEKWSRIPPVGTLCGLRPEEWPKQQKVDVVIECSGSPDGLPFALDRVRPRGSIILKSTFQGTPSFDMTAIALHEITIQGSRCGPFKPALNLLQRRLVTVESLIDATFPLNRAGEALALAFKPGTLKVLLDPRS
ncbi:MAG: alcohol dehydrogenase catalytic domain-containing protein [Magnetococcales bacterium]|nr:alcohol dehydrogenase catalytic domain-containing protein [Magnetococcales bacterium]